MQKQTYPNRPNLAVISSLVKLILGIFFARIPSLQLVFSRNAIIVFTIIIIQARYDRMMAAFK